MITASRTDAHPHLKVISMCCFQPLHDLPLVCCQLLKWSRAAAPALALQCPQICTMQCSAHASTEPCNAQQVLQPKPSSNLGPKFSSLLPLASFPTQECTRHRDGRLTIVTLHSAINLLSFLQILRQPSEQPEDRKSSSIAYAGSIHMRCCMDYLQDVWLGIPAKACVWVQQDLVTCII